MPDAVNDRTLATTTRPGLSPPAGRTRLLALPQVPHWVLLGTILASAVVVLGLTVQLVPGVSMDELGVDQSLSQHHVALLTGVAMALNLLFGPVAGLLAIAVIAAFLLLVRRAPVNAVAFAVMAGSGWVASEIFKVLVKRQRPDAALLFDPLAPESGTDSFPSGHVTFAVTIAFAMYLLARGTLWAKFTAVSGAVVVALVAWSRLYIGVHYPSDVVGSLLAGAAAVVLLAGLWNRSAALAFRKASCRHFMHWPR